jgi:hypothetical protein
MCSAQGAAIAAAVRLLALNLVSGSGRLSMWADWSPLRVGKEARPALQAAASGIAELARTAASAHHESHEEIESLLVQYRRTHPPLPTNLKQAVAYGLALLDEDSKHELSLLSYVDLHTKYATVFIGLVGEGLGIFDFSKQLLLADIATNHVDQLLFYEPGPEGVSAEGTVRIMLAAMAEQLRLAKHCQASL